MVKKMLKIQQAIALGLMLLLSVPLVALASDDKKHYKQGMQYENNQQWDKAAEQFALAVAEKPSNIEYRLHLQKCLVNAGAMLVERGNKLAEQKDYNAAYQAFRQAYSFDPTNEMALIKARRMLEKQGLPTKDLPSGSDEAGPRIKPEEDMSKKASFYKAGMPTANGVYFPSRNIPVQLPAVPGKRFSKTDVIYRDTPLLSAIEQLAQTMKLNIIFDQQVQNMMRAQKINVEMRDVTYPHAMEMILKTNNLMYAQLDTRTIVVASDNPASRMKYEPFSVRTFYIKNADIGEVKSAIQGSLATKSVTPIKQLNALIIRDTPANLELIESMINSLDKAKAEVLIDINIYEVSRNDLISIGNQFNTSDANKNAGTFEGFAGFGSGGLVQGFAHTFINNGPWGFTAGVPPSLLSFFQDKGKAKLLASTQVHVLDDQDQSIKIGQCVPIQTAFVPTYSTVVTTGANGQPNNPNTQNGNFNNFGYGGSGYPQIQYENVGLNIDMKPNVYEDEVQLKMKIDSSSVDSSINPLTPTFNQRTMSSMARIRDGQTTLVAGVTQTEQSKRVKGLPLIGLIPILGRFFSTPETKDRQSDVVITVTPHILRRADIRDEDHYAKYSGDAQNAYNQLRIEQILYLADQDEGQPPPVAMGGGQSETKPAATVPAATTPTNVAQPTPTGVVVGPIPTQPPASRADIQRTSVSVPGSPVKPQHNDATNQSQRNKLDDDDDDDDDTPNAQGDKAVQPVIVSVRAATPVATRGQDLYVAINLVGNNEISSAHISLSYDTNLLEPKSVRDSGLLRGGGAPPDLQFTGEGGQLQIQLDKPQGSGGAMARGQLCLIVFTVKNPGTSPLTLNEGQCFLRMPNGQVLPLRLQSSQVEAR
ncbi:MAG: secretin N-terminal domain-containing protein [Blastocatellia bacterium]